LNGGAAPLDSVTDLAGPIGVTVEPRQGRIWVADATASEVRVFDRNTAEVLRVPGLPAPREIAVDRVRGEAWVALGTTGQVARLAPNGAVMRLLGGFDQPTDIALITRP